jgi:hypothetical protein
MPTPTELIRPLEFPPYPADYPLTGILSLPCLAGDDPLRPENAELCAIECDIYVGEVTLRPDPAGPHWCAFGAIPGVPDTAFLCHVQCVDGGEPPVRVLDEPGALLMGVFLAFAGSALLWAAGRKARKDWRYLRTLERELLRARATELDRE